LYVSPAVEPIVGRMADAFYAAPHLWMDIIHPEDRSSVGDVFEACAGGGATEPRSATYRILRPDGQVRWIFDTMTPVRNEAGRVHRVGGIARDITAEREADAARRELESQLQQAHKLEALGTLASGIAHDFNNALAVIIGNTEIAREQVPTDPEVRESLDAVLTASARAQTLVRQILTFARYHGGERSVVDIGPVVQEAVWLMKAAVPAAIELALTVGPDLPAVFADRTEIQQVVMNLVSNAAQATKGAATIDIRLACASVPGEVGPWKRSPGQDTAVVLSVTDHGVGMDETTLRRAFEPFFTTKDVGAGTGLGLSIVHGIVQRHEGVIKVSSTPGVGSQFDVYLPAHRPEASRS